MVAKVAIVFYSMYGHIYQMAEAIAEGARSVEGVEVDLFQVPETLSNEVLEKMYALDAKKPFEHIPIIENPADLVEYDAIIFGTGTRFGSMTAQMKAFVDRMGQLWVGNKLRGKIASFFTSSASQPGAQETTLLSMFIPFFNLGCTVMGVPLMDEEAGQAGNVRSMLGATTFAGNDGSLQPTEKDLKVATYQGQHVAKGALGLHKVYAEEK